MDRRDPRVGFGTGRRAGHGRGARRHRRGSRTDAADDPDDHRPRAPAVPDRPGPVADRMAPAPHGGVHAQLGRRRRVRDRRRRDGAARPQGQGARRSGRRAARRVLPRDRPRRRVPLHRRARGRGAEGGRLRRGRTRRAEAEGRAQPQSGLRRARSDPRPRRVRREDPDRREHELERSGGDQVDSHARALRPPVRRAAGAGLRPRGARPGPAGRVRPDRGRRGVHGAPRCG